MCSLIETLDLFTKAPHRYQYDLVNTDLNIKDFHEGLTVFSHDY